MEARLGLALDVGEVVPNIDDSPLVGDRAMSRDHGLDIHSQHEITGRYPIGQGSGPDDRCSADEEDVTGEDALGVGDVNDHIATCVRRANFDQLDRSTAHLQIETAVEGSSRQPQFDAVELEGTEESTKQITDFARRRSQCGQHRWRNFTHLVCRSRGGDDVGSIDELVSVTVVPVCVRIHQ